MPPFGLCLQTRAPRIFAIRDILLSVVESKNKELARPTVIWDYKNREKCSSLTTENRTAACKGGGFCLRSPV